MVYLIVILWSDTRRPEIITELCGLTANACPATICCNPILRNNVRSPHPNTDRRLRPVSLGYEVE